MSTLIQNNKKMAITLVIATILLSIITPFINTEPIMSILLIAICYIIIIAFFKPKLGFFLLLITRPLFDIFSDKAIINLGTFSINCASLVGVTVITLGLFIIIKNYKKIKTIPLTLPILTFLFVAIISIFYSYNHQASIIESLRLLSIFSFFILGYFLINTKEDLIRLIKIIILSVAIPGAVAFYQFFTQTGMSLPFEGIYNRIFGTFAHPNLFAYYLVAPLLLSLFIVLSKDKKDTGVIMFFLIFSVLLTLLILTYARGAWLAFMIAIFIIGITKYRKLLLTTILISILLYVVVEPINERTNDLFNNRYSSIDWRIDLWQDGIKYFTENPLLGHGAGTAKEVILKKRGYKFGSSDPHNDYLKISIENGVLGLASYFALIFSAITVLLKKYKQSSQPTFKNLILVFIGLTTSLYIMSFVDNILRDTALQWIYWALFGSILSNLK